MRNLKKIMFFALFLSALVTYSTSCNKSDEILEETFEDNFQNLEFIASDQVSVEDGRLVFPDLEHFNDVSSSISTENMDRVNEWRSPLNFTSMSEVYDAAMDELENIESEAAYDNFERNHQDKILFTEDGSLDVLTGSYILSALLNPNGEVIVGDMLFKFTDQHLIIIADKDESKLDAATRSLQSNYDNHIFITEWNQKLDRSCGYSLGCMDDDGSNRIKAKYSINAYSQPNYSFGVFNGTWNVLNSVHIDIDSQRKNWRGRWKPRKKVIDFSIGYEAQSFGNIQAGGTGWTTSTPLSSLEYTIQLYDQWYYNVPTQDLSAFGARFNRVGGHATTNDLQFCDNNPGAINFYCPQ